MLKRLLNKIFGVGVPDEVFFPILARSGDWEMDSVVGIVYHQLTIVESNSKGYKVRLPKGLEVLTDHESGAIELKWSGVTQISIYPPSLYGGKAVTIFWRTDVMFRLRT
jgi:hypothetical protein